ncbi:hypothetical protein KUV62_07190 [Salipiger bermudensis]|nr:hypothetical protein [Salipiger bermudensis]MBY6003684.1 hypothetical protein [Salipiger bermudensis]
MSAIVTILLMAACVAGLFALNAVAIWWFGRLPVADQQTTPTVGLNKQA